MVRPQDPPKIASDINFSKLGKSLKIFPFKVIQKYSGNFRNTTLLGHKCYIQQHLFVAKHSCPFQKKTKKMRGNVVFDDKKGGTLGNSGRTAVHGPIPF